MDVEVCWEGADIRRLCTTSLEKVILLVYMLFQKEYF